MAPAWQYRHNHAVNVSMEEVIRAVATLEHGWSSKEVAKVLGLPPRSVRSAIGWLHAHDLVEIVGVAYTARGSRRQPYKLYAIRSHASADSIEEVMRRWEHG